MPVAAQMHKHPP